MELKIGDKVKIINRPHYPSINETGTVEYVNDIGITINPNRRVFMRRQVYIIPVEEEVIYSET